MPTAEEYKKNKPYYDRWNVEYLLVQEHRSAAKKRANRWYKTHQAQRQLSDKIAYLHRCGLSEGEIRKAVQNLQKKNIRCAICKTKCPEKGRGAGRWCVDHDHRQKTFRGILCLTCNSAIGFLRDDANLLRAAVKYLEK